MTFGTATLVDLLSWIVAALLGLKLVATIVLLRRGRRTMFERSSGVALWWATKITPLIAVPCMIAVASLRHDAGAVIAYAGLMLFVLVAVPLMIRQRYCDRPGPTTPAPG